LFGKGLRQTFVFEHTLPPIKFLCRIYSISQFDGFVNGFHFAFQKLADFYMKRGSSLFAADWSLRLAKKREFPK
jgi:hypothetical protein